MDGHNICEMKLGDSASFEKTISESDVYMFAGITGDLNPAHVNAVNCEHTRFKKRIAHGALSAGLVSTVIGMYLPGPGTIYLSQSSKFTAPVYIGDTIKAEVIVLDINQEKNRVKLKTVCTNQDGVVVLDGEAFVIPPL